MTRLRHISILSQPQPRLFIGHGHDDCWRAVREFVEDDCGLATVSFESESRVGYGIRDVLTACLDESSAAVCVLTAEDRTASRTVRARQNVIHEVGLCQGRYGFGRVAVLVEEGIELPSNLDGIVQLRFPPGRVETVFGELRRMLEREGVAG